MINESDNRLIYYALGYWANWIETGNITMSAADAINCGERNKLQSLTLEQQKFVTRLRDLAAKQIF